MQLPWVPYRILILFADSNARFLLDSRENGGLSRNVFHGRGEVRNSGESLTDLCSEIP